MKHTLICLLLFQNLLIAQEFEPYLSQNKATVQVNKQQQFDLLNADLKNTQIVLFGENHGSSQPHDVDFLLFKEFYKNQGIRHYIAEVDPTKAWMLNNYLQDGDEMWLQKVFKSWQTNGAQWANTSNYNKYKNLHLFYKSLPANNKFTIIGIDVIQDYGLLSEFCSKMLNARSLKISLMNDLMKAIDTNLNKDKKKIGEIARSIKHNMQSNVEYKKSLKKNYDVFDLFIKNAGYINNKMYRDSIMYRSFEDAMSTLKLEKSKLYGFLGFYHTLQNSYGNSFPFASHLKKSDRKVISIQMLAIDCKVLLPYDENIKKVMPLQYVESLRKQNPDFPLTDKYIPYDLSNDNTMMKADGIDDLKKQTEPNTITLFKLDGTNSPYTKGKKLAEITGFQTLKMTDTNQSTVDAFQYVILFRNSSFGVPYLN